MLSHPVNTYKTLYGLDWDPDVNDVQIDMILAKKWREEPYCLSNGLLEPGEHMLRAIRALFTPAQWTISPWTEEHAWAWTSFDFSVWLGAASTGKAQPHDELVQTPAGPRPIGDLVAGDEVIGLTGKPVKVKAVHEVGMKEEYRVTARDGRTTLCAADHLWTVFDRMGSTRSGEAGMRTLPASGINPKFHTLPYTGVVEFEPRPVPMEPYLLGALLGDGSLGGSSACPMITNKDTGVLAKISECLPGDMELAYQCRYGWSIVKKSGKNNGANSVIAALKSMGLRGTACDNKFIPEDYIYNAVEVRRDVLSGLLDTGGTVCRKSGRISFTSASKQLADGVAAIARSLGARASVAKKPRGCKKNGVWHPGKDAYEVGMSFSTVELRANAVKFHVAEKHRRLGTFCKAKRTGITAEPTGRTVPMRCITVDAGDGLYLTKDFMPTHNSNDAGGLAVVDWLTDPFDTYISLASTSVQMLKMRSFESVTRYYRHLRRNAKLSGMFIPGKEAASLTAIINDNTLNDEDEDEVTAKASIRGVALSDGDESKAVARLAGAHLPYVTMILDEGTALPEAAAKARFNAAAGTIRFRFLSLANPVSKYDEATKFCEPVDGWDSVDENTPHWMSKFGLVLHHNGFKSPAIIEPEGEKKYPFLINGKQISKMVGECGGNADDPMIWRMVVGFPAPSNLEATVMSPADIATFRAHEAPVWQDNAPRYKVAGLDPAFTSGGDACLFQAAEIGWSAEGIYTVAFYPRVRIPILASSSRPASYQVVDALKDLMADYGIQSIRDVAVDDSGTQSVADIIEVEFGEPPLRVNFSNKATPLPAEFKGRAPKPRYKNIVTEIWHNMARMVRSNQIRNLSDEAAEQYCSRRFRRDITPLALETKKEYKTRVKGQKSPDDADATSLCGHAAVVRGGVVLGQPTTCSVPDYYGDDGRDPGGVRLDRDTMDMVSDYLDGFGGGMDAYAGY